MSHLVEEEINDKNSIHLVCFFLSNMSLCTVTCCIFLWPLRLLVHEKEIMGLIVFPSSKAIIICSIFLFVFALGFSIFLFYKKPNRLIVKKTIVLFVILYIALLVLTSLFIEFGSANEPMNIIDITLVQDKSLSLTIPK